MRALSILARLPMAAWLGIAGMGVQAALPLFLAFAVASADRMDMAGGPQSAIHPHHTDHVPGHHRHNPADHHRHANCTLCQGLHAAGPFTLPAAMAVVAPHSERRSGMADTPAAEYVRGSPASYASRAPPAIV